MHQKFRGNFIKFDSPISIQKEFERIIIEFSWKSSQIEGNTYSLLETERLIGESEETKGKTHEEAQMILNHKKAFDFVLTNPEYFQKIQKKNLEEIHTLLTRGLRIIPNIRTLPIGIIGTEYKPLDNPLQIEEALRFTFDLLEKKQTDFYERNFYRTIQRSRRKLLLKFHRFQTLQIPRLDKINFIYLILFRG